MTIDLTTLLQSNLPRGISGYSGVSGVQATTVDGANVSGQVATANYAAYAGNVTIAGQGNITSVGNLDSITVNDGNVVRPTMTINPAGNVVGGASSNVALLTITDYGSQANTNPENITFIKSRGNATSPTPAANADNMMRMVCHVNSGNGYPRAVALTTSAPLAASSTYNVSGVTWTPGQFNVTTGNPFGNVTSSTSTSPQNLYNFNQYGTLSLIQGSPGNGLAGTEGGMSFTSFGRNANGSGRGSRLYLLRGHGNRDGVSSVVDGDNLGYLGFHAYTNTNLLASGALALIEANVDTTNWPIANTHAPTKIIISSVGNNSLYSYTFDTLGGLTIPGNVVSSNANLGNLTTSNYFAGTLTTAAQPNITSVGLLSNASISGNLVLANATNHGIQVDTTTPVWGWRDILGQIFIRGAGTQDPSWVQYNGVIYDYQFTLNDEITLNFHLPHDYVPGTDIYAHVHWSLNGAGISENITWEFSSIYAKGHNQAAFTATPLVTSAAAAASSTTQYQHMITETAISSAAGSAGVLYANSIFEVDGLIIMRAKLIANSGTGTGTSRPFVHGVDLHYQSTNMATKGKAPAFY